jgi:oligopeptide transport system substrate-binding protein
MKNAKFLKLQTMVCVLLLILLSACGQTPPAAPLPTITATSLPVASPTNTVTPIPTITDTPGPTAIPGVEIYPVSSLGDGVPWLPLEKGNEPMSVYFGFNVNKPPFDNALVRQAFAAAIDREQIANEAESFKFRNVTPATSLTPPQTLGRNLYGDVGIPFDPSKAKDLLSQAGYPDGVGFPSVTLIVSTRGKDAPEAYTKMAQSIVEMWKTHLGVNVNIEVESNWGQYLNIIKGNSREIYEMGWGADANDPDNFLKFLFYSTSEFNYGGFNNPEFDRLVDRAAKLSDPLERQILYIQAEKILTEQEAGAIPLFHSLYYLRP